VALNINVVVDVIGALILWPEVAGQSVKIGDDRWLLLGD